MERSLENLNKRMEEYWLDELDTDSQGRMQMGQRFIKYKESVTSLRVTVEKHFNTLMWEIMNGLPSIACNDESTAEDYSFDGSNVGQEWSCTVCLTKNQIYEKKCIICGSAKPQLVYKGKPGNAPLTKSNYNPRKPSAGATVFLAGRIEREQ